MLYTPGPAVLVRLREQRFNPHHGSDGKFASSDGSGVRPALAGATTTSEVAAAFTAEAQRITGRDIGADFEGADVQIAKEHSEGILQGLERFPNASLVGVSTYGPGTTLRPHDPRAGLQDNAYAVTSRHFTTSKETGKFGPESIVYFNNRHSANADHYRDQLKDLGQNKYGVAHDPRGVALHEFGHVVAFHDAGTPRQVADSTVAHAEKAGTTPHHYMEQHISSYAASNPSELTAEAFADVMLNGSRASAASHDAFSIIEANYKATTGQRAALRHMPGKHDQSTHGRGKGGVRASLARANNNPEVAAAFTGEAKRITGQDIEADFSGSDLQMAKEHSEGILRSLEKHPATQLGRVGTYGPGGNWTNYISGDAYAITESHAGPERLSPNGKKRVRTDAIFFNNSKSGKFKNIDTYRSDLEQMHSDGHSVIRNPREVAIHEMGHVFANYGGKNGYDRSANVMVHVYGPRTTHEAVSLIEKQISRYATYDQYEMTAEMFAQVAIKGPKASKLSKEGMAILEHEHKLYVSTLGF